MQTLSEIRDLLAQRGLRPKHRLGQNFLHDKNQLRKLVDVAAVSPGEVVLEIGPGTGTLTETLVEVGATVIAAEIDDDLADIVTERLGAAVTLVRGDCLDRGRVLSPALLAAIDGRPFKLVANLPYQVASPVIATLLLAPVGCTGQFVTIQQEVADRLLAPPGGKTYGPLGIIVQALAEVERIAVVRPGSFWPAPQVTSAMVAIRPRANCDLEDPPAFARFVRDLFSRRRKQLGTIFGRDTTWPEGITGDRRPDALSVAELVSLWRTGMTPR
ncbi:MAG: ribosomal RNA small subunit methyltransferase A [Phycisphaerales bacterium]|nr:ribosomal RNA small subunit methyltransferase A [Phycisphaerales bacterium]NNM26344.1 ribosomal RNA small subunit methyltransferase A [Phycisphaerales bacterium]